MSENGCCTMGTKDAIARYGLEELKNRINSHYGILSSEPSLRYCDNDIFVTEDLLRKQFMEEKEMNHKITLIGSMKNKDAMMDVYNRLTLRGDLVMLPYMGVIPEDADDDMIEQLHDIHREKMRVADFVVVVDQNGYIGKDTQAEIKWCESQGKRIIYASDFEMVSKPKERK